MMTEVLSGALITGHLIAGLFFLKFWSASSDRLFLIFGFAFWILAIQRLSLVLFAHVPSAHVYLYSVRLLAFMLILAAIIDKNRVTPEAE